MLTPAILENDFVTYFNTASTAQYFSPGRVNLIGEHIDYNGGYVLPVAISLGITALVANNNSQTIHIIAQSFNQQHSINLNEPLPLQHNYNWVRYIAATLQVLRDNGVTIVGKNILINSDLPLSSGLSSSAALECLIAYIFNEEYYNNNRTQLALDAQLAETKYVGVNCGIMDQFAVANGKQQQAILLNCANLDYEYIPADFQSYSLLIINSNQPRNLIESKYNERRQECETAYQQLAQYDIAKNLCHIHEISLTYLEDDVLYKRAKHAITEHNRVIHAMGALRLNEIEAFGNLLTQSHISLDEDYEVSGDTLNALVHYATHHPSCIGARMTGAGFGGCCIALVEKGKETDFITFVGKKYNEKTNLVATSYPCTIVDGVKRLNN